MDPKTKTWVHLKGTEIMYPYRPRADRLGVYFKMVCMMVHQYAKHPLAFCICLQWKSWFQLLNKHKSTKTSKKRIQNWRFSAADLLLLSSFISTVYMVKQCKFVGTLELSELSTRLFLQLMKFHRNSSGGNRLLAETCWSSFCCLLQWCHDTRK